MLSRRNFLTGAGAAALLPLMGRLTLAAAPGDNRFVCVILRGGMDGLDVVRPVGDKAFAALRPEQAASPGIGLDGFYSLHPALAPLEPLFKAKELSFAHAVATPYRSRSHFEGQDMLELGGEATGLHDGWMNRLLGLVGTAPAVDINAGPQLILTGQKPVKAWYPETRINMKTDSLQFLERLYADDPLLKQALAGIETETGKMSPEDNTDPGVSNAEVARLAARFLKGDMRIAAFSITGWDTHIQQAGRLERQLTDLAKTLLTLKETLGPLWSRTAVAMVSEFGRTAHFNGSGGTDHGTGGLAIMAGGLLASGQGGLVLADWPGLDTLHDNRDLMPTVDVRRYLGSLCSDLYAVQPDRIATTVFPGLDLSKPVRLL